MSDNPDLGQAERKRLIADLDSVSAVLFRDGAKEQSDVIQDAMNELSVLAARLAQAVEELRLLEALPNERSLAQRLAQAERVLEQIADERPALEVGPLGKAYIERTREIARTALAAPDSDEPAST